MIDRYPTNGFTARAVGRDRRQASQPCRQSRHTTLISAAPSPSAQPTRATDAAIRSLTPFACLDLSSRNTRRRPGSCPGPHAPQSVTGGPKHANEETDWPVGDIREGDRCPHRDERNANRHTYRKNRPVSQRAGRSRGPNHQAEHQQRAYYRQCHGRRKRQDGHERKFHRAARYASRLREIRRYRTEQEWPEEHRRNRNRETADDCDWREIGVTDAQHFAEKKGIDLLRILARHAQEQRPEA